MSTQLFPGDEKDESNNDDAIIKPDPETLHTTDPQEHMSGPISSLVKGAEDSFEGNDKNGAEEKED